MHTKKLMIAVPMTKSASSARSQMPFKSCSRPASSPVLYCLKNFAGSVSTRIMAALSIQMLILVFILASSICCIVRKRIVTIPVPSKRTVHDRSTFRPPGKIPFSKISQFAHTGKIPIMETAAAANSTATKSEADIVLIAYMTSSFA